MDLTAIQDKLKRQALASDHHPLEIPIDWPTLDGPMSTSVGRGSDPRLTTTVENLRRRSLRAYGDSEGRTTVSLPQTASSVGVLSANPIAARPIISSAFGAPHQPLSEASAQIQIYRQRLQAMVDKINHLSIEQRRAIAELQVTQRELVERPRERVSELSHGFSSPQITLDRAATASAELDPLGNIRLSYQPIRLQQPDQEARQLAGHLRKTYGTGSTPPGPSSFARFVVIKVLGILSQEPMDWLTQCGRLIQSLIAPVTPRRRKNLQRAKVGNAARVFPSFMDTLLWLGGGVITRLTLDLLLSAFSGLWPLTVVAITGIVAYALYQATLALQPNLGLANRVFLALAGLFIGGYL